MNALKSSLLVAAGAVATVAGSQVVASADTYSVKSGDTLYSLAQTFNTSVDEIVNANHLSNADLIFSGQSLTIPGTSAAADTTNDSASTANSNDGTYTVVSGDTLYAIANKNGMTLADLLSANNLDASQIIYPGQVLKLSGNASAPAANNDSNASSNVNVNAPQNNNNDSSSTSTVNTYPYGQCTWYVKSQLSWVGNYWGNAADWTASAAAAGHKVSNVPSAGSVAVFGAGVQGADGTYGHVAVVDSVNPDGTIDISEANYAGLLYHTRTISTAGLQFIAR